jgi:hypothetical protein
MEHTSSPKKMLLYYGYPIYILELNRLPRKKERLFTIHQFIPSIGEDDR